MIGKSSTQAFLIRYSRQFADAIDHGMNSDTFVTYIDNIQEELVGLEESPIKEEAHLCLEKINASNFDSLQDRLSRKLISREVRQLAEILARAAARN